MMQCLFLSLGNWESKESEEIRVKNTGLWLSSYYT